MTVRVRTIESKRQTVKWQKQGETNRRASQWQHTRWGIRLNRGNTQEWPENWGRMRGQTDHSDTTCHNMSGIKALGGCTMTMMAWWWWVARGIDETSQNKEKTKNILVNRTEKKANNFKWGSSKLTSKFTSQMFFNKDSIWNNTDNMHGRPTKSWNLLILVIIFLSSLKLKTCPFYWANLWISSLTFSSLLFIHMRTFTNSPAHTLLGTGKNPFNYNYVS